jgi:hypothetical protein
MTITTKTTRTKVRICGQNVRARGAGLVARATAVVAACAGLACPALAQTSLTIYSSAQPGAIQPEMYRPVGGVSFQRWDLPGYAMVREVRPITLDGARATVRFTDIAALIDPTTVSFASLTSPETRVLDQSFQFDLVSNEALLQKFIDKEITVVVPLGDTVSEITGKLLSAAYGQLILQTTSGLQSIGSYLRVKFPTLPEGFVTRPTLVWDLQAPTAGEQTARVSYQTEGITWWADYNLTFAESEGNSNKGTLDVGAWVSILNQSGGTYKDAQLKLVAGDVNRAPKLPGIGGAYPMASMARMELAEPGGFQQKSFFEYHLYTLGRPATIPDRSTKQIELFDTARKVPCEKILVYDGAGEYWMGDGDAIQDSSYGTQGKKDVDVYLKFVNSKEAGLGMPLPAGRIRVSQLDADGGTGGGSLEFIGEDVVRHTPRDETVLVRLGKSFDVVGERRQMDIDVDTGRRMINETFEIKVRNRKDVPIDLVVQERMYRGIGWSIVRSSQDPVKVDSRRVHFPVTLRPGEERVVTYTVRYTW